tara:strand:- start:365 stop:475 length:111 start_codon:yes stop_codon:yes gene_type:complete
VKERREEEEEEVESGEQRLEVQAEQSRAELRDRYRA